jgi:DNA repair exonuclease SbcCD ATPase subunit
MYNPTFIQFQNLFSHRESEYQFDKGHLTLIHGDNRDAKGSNSNGGGKSTLIEAIYLALHGECYREVEKEDFISTWADSCQVTFGLYSPIQQENLLVRRTFHRKKGVKVELWLNDVLQEQLTSVSESNLFLFNRLGISKQDLGNYYVISQGNNSSFFTASDTQQKEMIGRFANFSAIDKLLENIRKDLKGIDREIQVVTGEQLGKQAVQENLLELLADTQDVHALALQEHREAVQQAEATHGRAKASYTADVLLSTEEEEVLVQLQSELPPLEAAVAETKDSLEILNESAERLEEYQTNLHKLNRTEAKLQVALSGSIECPKC